MNAGDAPGEHVEITGTVRNVQAAVLPGVTVSPAGEPSVKAVTDKDGRYHIRVRLNDSLVFTLAKYSTVSIPVRGISSIDVDMDPLID